MKVRFHRKFRKEFQKLPLKDRIRFERRLGVFLQDPFDPILNNHALKGKYRGYRSINVTGDIRAIYESSKWDTALFVAIGSHSELYQ